MESWLQNLLLKWRSEGVKLNPPASIAEIENAESILDFKFPQDFKDFYLQANGFEDCEWQEHMFSFWSLDRILEEFQGSPNKNFIGFCDFLLSSSCIGFFKNESGVFKSYYKNDGELIADSYEMIVDMINSNNNLIY